MVDNQGGRADHIAVTGRNPRRPGVYDEEAMQVPVEMMKISLLVPGRMRCDGSNVPEL